MADSNIVCSGLTANPGLNQIILNWAAADATDFRSLSYMQLSHFEVWQASTNNRANASIVGRPTMNAFNAPVSAASATRYFWVRAIDKSPTANAGDFFPLSATAGVAGTTATATPADNSIDHDMLQDDAVDTNNIRSGAVVTESLDALAVTAQKLAADAVTADKISVNNLAAISATLGNVVVNGSLIVNGTLVTGKAASEAWTIIRGGANGDAITAAQGVTKVGASCIQPSQNKPIMVVGSCAVDGTSGTAAPYIEIGLYRNNTKLVAYRLRADNANRFRPAALVFCDSSPGSGDITYSLRQTGIDADSAVGQTSGHAIATFQGLR